MAKLVGWRENNSGIWSKNFPTKGACGKGLRFADGARARWRSGSWPCLLMSYLELQFGIGCMKDFVMGMGWEFAKYRWVYFICNAIHKNSSWSSASLSLIMYQELRYAGARSNYVWI